ncbi:hypothetical protein [Fulvivirga imtechensis]|nr:hypothetical protein [Fulvivirga imtechensis]
MILRNIILISISLWVFSCGKSIDKQHAQYIGGVMTDNPAYSVDFGTAENTSQTVRARLLANPGTQELIVLLSMMNTTKDTITLTPNDFRLSTEEGNTVQPVNLDTTTAITPENIVHLKLKFSIINSRLFYSTTGLAGDMNQEYQLKVNFRGHPITLDWRLSEEVFNNYSGSYGIEEKVIVFMPELDENAQKSYQVLNGMNTFIHSGGTEIATAGINTRFRSYHIKDTLHLAVRLVNHSDHEIRIYPEGFVLRLDHQLLIPGQTTGPVHLKKSERYIGSFTYVVDKTPVRFLLLKEAIKILPANNERNLFANDLTFKVAEEQVP